MRAKDLRGRLSYLADSVRTAASNITNSRMRSVLTIVIVTLGITCLVGAQTAIDCLSSLLAGVFGTNSERISITAAKSRGGAGARKAPAISYQQAQRFLAEFEAAQLAGGDCLKTVYTYAPAVDVHNASGRLGPQTTVIAFEGDYFACNGITVSQGRPFGALDAGSNVCIVGKKVAAQAALGSQLYIGGKAYQVVGELQEQLSLLGMLTDNSVFVPIGAAMGSLIGETSNYSIDLSVAGEASAAAALAR
ncbi:MAG: ABC transporter permease, partial [Bacteroidales bacterium]|nr:ABC transporter permease [Bacteroidales bacterium]